MNRRPIFLAAWLALLATASLGVGAEPLEIKGIQLGVTTPEEVKARFPGVFVSSSGIILSPSAHIAARCGRPAATQCMSDAIDEIRVGGGAGGDYFFRIVDGVVTTVIVTFSQGGFATARAAVVGKYGEPSSRKTVELQNRAGAKFQSEQLIWKRDDGDIRLTERTDAIDSSELVMRSKAQVERDEAAAAKKLKDAPSKL
jgi:hypothetical protein